MPELEGWTQSTYVDGERSYPVYRRGSGPGVVVIHEVPGITPAVRRFGDEVCDAGFTVVMPSLFGTPGRPLSALGTAKAVMHICVSHEFTSLALNRTSPVTIWLRALARDLHDELGGPGVGALGMCFAGGFALAMMIDEHTVAPVLSQPSMPFFIRGRAYGADLNLDPDDLATVQRRAAAGCPVLGLRYSGDPMVGTRFDTLREKLGDNFTAIEFPGRKHSVLTEHRQETAVAAVIDFLAERLAPTSV